MTHDGAGEPVAAGDERHGLLLAVCVGHRCAGLQHLAGHADPLAWAREAVRASRGSVLVAAQCMSACALAPVAAAAPRSEEDGRCGALVWLAGLDDPRRTAEVSRWVTTGGALPAELRDAVVAVGSPARLARLLGSGPLSDPDSRTSRDPDDRPADSPVAPVAHRAGGPDAGGGPAPRRAQERP